MVSDDLKSHALLAKACDSSEGSWRRARQDVVRNTHRRIRLRKRVVDVVEESRRNCHALDRLSKLPYLIDVTLIS